MRGGDITLDGRRGAGGRSRGSVLCCPLPGPQPHPGSVSSRPACAPLWRAGKCKEEAPPEEAEEEGR